MEPQTNANKPVRKAITRVLISIAIAILIFLVFINGVKLVFGTQYPFMVVVSNSMYPTLKVNDLIVVSSVDPSTLDVGDIIVFYNPFNPSERIVHRIYEVVSRDPPIFRTKGDNNSFPDAWRVTEGYIIGKVEYVIPGIGIIPRLLQPPFNYYLIGIIILVIFLLEVSDEIKRSKLSEEEYINENRAEVD